VSSEATYDFLRFYIDNTEKDAWSGEEDWAEVTYNVSAGTHTFKWIYEKDYSVANGDDCAWVDFIIFPPTASVNAQAGADGEICEDETFQCAGNATYYNTLEWTTSGTGEFSDITILDPVYTPDSEDISAGSVVLTLTAFDEEGSSDSDEMTLTFNLLPGTPSNITGETEVCGGASEIYSCDPIINATSLNWEITPDMAGTITVVNDNEITVLWSESFSGMATLKVRGMNDCGYGDYSEEMSVEIFDCTGVGETGFETVTVYPNPAKDILYINLGKTGGSPIEIGLTNLLGSVVFTEVFTSEQTIISLNTKNMVDGIYFLKIADQSNTITRKIIVQH
jgi:hypothetical protein